MLALRSFMRALCRAIVVAAGLLVVLALLPRAEAYHSVKILKPINSHTVHSAPWDSNYAPWRHHDTGADPRVYSRYE
jgi:hypothetical protein